MEKLKIYARTVEDEAVQQINAMNESEAYKDCLVRIMPDCHAGAGCTIGTVVAIKDRIVPNTVGVDIGCGMYVVRWTDKDIDLKKLDEVIRSFVPSGFNIHENPVMDFDYSGFRCQEIIDEKMANCSIGSLGGGNHFIEVDVDSQGFKYLIIHSGSRNLGLRVCKYYQDKAIKYCKSKALDKKALVEKLKAEGREKEIAEEIAKAKAEYKPIYPQLAYLEGQDMEDYLHDMALCQKYAKRNRICIAMTIAKQMEDDELMTNLVRPGGAFHTIHNYIDVEHRILRKGAVRALYNELLIIPMNMRDGSLVCIGKGNIDWLYSAPHGAGRIMSRKKAKEVIALADYEQSMDGIFTSSVCAETLDEAPMVYKPIQEIIDCVGDTVDVKDVIKPIYNFKAKE